MRQVVVVFLTGLLWSSAAIAQSASSPAPDQASAATSQPSPQQQQAVEQNLKDVHFAFDQYDLTPEDHQILQANAEWLKTNPDVRISIAGDADERGEIVYNVVLSQKRAETARDALVALGVSADRIDFATGWGKLYPVCNQSDESCWTQNRRAHFTPGTLLQTETVALLPKPLLTMACGTFDCR